MTEQQPKPYRVEVGIEAPRTAVWQAISEPELIREWFGWDYEGIDGEIRYIFVEHAKLDPPERVLFDDGSFIELATDGPTTIVRAVLPGDLDGTGWDEIYDGMAEGWRTFFEQLRFLLEARPTGRRRTVYLTGAADAATALAIVGDPGGRPWHDSRFQRMIVDPAGHLVVVAGQSPLTGGDSGPVSITVTTNGLDDDAFAAVRDEWTARWCGVADAKVTTDAGEASVAGHPPTG